MSFAITISSEGCCRKLEEPKTDEKTGKMNTSAKIRRLLYICQKIGQSGSWAIQINKKRKPNFFWIGGDLAALQSIINRLRS